MIRGETKSGFKFEIDERVFTDWGILQAIADIEFGEPTKAMVGVTNLANLMLGKNGMNELLTHIRESNDGFAPIETVQNELIEIFNASESAKKS